MKIVIGSDHAGYLLKETIKKHLEQYFPEIICHDLGVFNETSVDYPDIAVPLSKSVASGEYQRGIIVCGTGIGVAIAANKTRGIRAAPCQETFTTRMARQHNDINVLTLGARSVGEGLALDIVSTFLSTSYEGGRHQRRLDKIEKVE